ncbi:MAG TPA: phospho-N-acetylmuramoyl-pentapeptide-transferase [Ruminococcaceae bacterium]|jgi:phospho-N-acetylmuramoyl-pentapeptide-transferase|nr:phospho-N-acetylmuramoyl-pentapeptide-transferase [Oscillospiraceae bacterium]HCC03137.1 phospho-N-acetylmuramoyl-pentapeptide-transferase [Oscillospiraceae bacterium]HCM23550.1 phospho-N-acetylmuramoyl-pentapeptide-transferase [Oscillospiraceae bacterium]
MDVFAIVLAAVIAFAVTALLGKWMVPFLHKLNFGQTIREVGPKWHQKKNGTPTMGGFMFMIGILVALAACVPLTLENGKTLSDDMVGTRVIGGYLMALAFGAIGFLDDYIKVVKKRNLGLTVLQKLILQCIVAGGFLLTMKLGGATSVTMIPFVGPVDFGIWYWIVAFLGIVGMVNAVNFTDGIDGLNGSVTFFVAVFFMIIAGMLKSVGMGVFAAACAGGCLGFLIWNFNPAKVFMGDTGSLFLGGMVCAMGFGLNIPILILVVGIIYIIEILSVILQVIYFKATHGKRLFKMTPIHHSFEMRGWSEIKICSVFSMITAVAGVIALLLAMSAYGVL